MRLRLAIWAQPDGPDHFSSNFLMVGLYIFIYLINPILNIYNFIFYLSFKFYSIIYVFFYKNEVILVYKLN